MFPSPCVSYENASTTANGLTTRYIYNADGNLVQTVYPHQYNPANDNLDISAESPVDAYANSAVGNRYTYDADGRVLTYTDKYGNVTTNTYDAGGDGSGRVQR